MNVFQFHRTYRPKFFKEVVGQETQVQTLVNHIKHNACPQAILFSGNSGVGKTTLARLVAKRLNCHNPQGTEPCGECASCKDIESESFSRNVFMIDASSSRGIQQIEELKEDIESYPLYGDKYKIYIFDEAHMLTQQAFNSFLTVLEEPPEHVFFFFSTTQKKKILSTIKTRCVHIDLSDLSDKDVSKGLFLVLSKMGVKVDRLIMASLNRIAEISFGSMREALNYLQVLYYNDALSIDKAEQFLPSFDNTTLGKCIKWLFSKDPKILEYVDTLETMRDMDIFFLQMKKVLKTTVLVKAGAKPNVPDWMIKQAQQNANLITIKELIFLVETFNLDITKFYSPKEIFFARIASYILGEIRDIDEKHRF